MSGLVSECVREWISVWQSVLATLHREHLLLMNLPGKFNHTVWSTPSHVMLYHAMATLTIQSVPHGVHRNLVVSLHHHQVAILLHTACAVTGCCPWIDHTTLQANSITFPSLSPWTQPSPPSLSPLPPNQIMLNQAEDVQSIIAGKTALRHIGDEVDAMRQVAKAHQQRSLKDFEQALRDYHKQLSDDPIISRHLSALYDSLLEQNLLRLIEPFSCVEISHVAALIDLPMEQVRGEGGGVGERRTASRFGWLVV